MADESIPIEHEMLRAMLTLELTILDTNITSFESLDDEIVHVKL